MDRKVIRARRGFLTVITFMSLILTTLFSYLYIDRAITWIGFITLESILGYIVIKVFSFMVELSEDTIRVRSWPYKSKIIKYTDIGRISLSTGFVEKSLSTSGIQRLEISDKNGDIVMSINLKLISYADFLVIRDIFVSVIGNLKISGYLLSCSAEKNCLSQERIGFIRKNIPSFLIYIILLGIIFAVFALR